MRRLLQVMVLLCTAVLVAPDAPLVAAGAAGATSVRADGLADRLAVGTNHACALLDNGTVTCWGAGFDGQLGYGNSNPIGDDETPATNPANGGIVPLPDDRLAVAITAGEAHTCALLDNGTVTCWGSGSFGRLGYGNTNAIGGSSGNTPATNPVNGGIVALPGGQTATAISAGARHTCAVLSDATITCWGDGADGRLGYGNTNAIGNDVGETPATNPVNGGIVALPGGQTASAISAGGAHTCALLTSGDVTCWGSGGNGRLGYGNLNSIGNTPGNTPSTNPVDGGLVQLPSGQAATAIATGANHTCALMENFDVICWGAASLGQLGTGGVSTIGDDETPVSAPTLTLQQGANSISATGLHTCAILGLGDVTCWGFNDVGQLGYGNTNSIGDDPGETPTTNPVNGGLVPLPGQSRAIAIAAGTNLTCALLDNGVLTCWGAGGSGQLGMGNTNSIGDTETPAANPVGGGAIPLSGAAATAVDAGSSHSCALLGNGSVSCWGAGPNGRLGYGVVANIGDNEFPAANATRGGLVDLPFGRTATAVSSGDSHTCALLDDGQVTCWGVGADGRLGYGNTNSIGDDERPADNPVNGGVVQLPGDRTAVSISAGGAHTCAVLDSGSVTCWGDGAVLGYGSSNDIGDDETPATNPVNGGIVPLPAGRKAVAVSAGFAATCALLDNGTVSCWGDGLFGALGYSNPNFIGNTPGNTPATNPVNGGVVPLPSGRKAIAVETSGLHTCALLDDASLTCWGSNSSGQLGRGNTDTIGDDESLASFGALSLPQPTVVDFSVGSEHTCAVFSNGSVSCWGEGTNGRLGGGNTLDLGNDEAVTTTVSLPAGRTAVRVAAGAAHTCVTLDNGTASCWGLGSAGRLGYSNLTTIGDDELPSANAVNGGQVRMPSHLSVVQYRALQPARLLDTRSTGVTIDGQFQGFGQQSGNTSFTLNVAGRGGVPIDATSVTLSVAAVSPVANGFVTVWPCAEPQPNASSLNHAAGVTTANTVITGIAGGVCVFTSQPTHLIADVVGYTPRSSSYVSLTPTRYADTRASGATFDDDFEADGARAAGSTYTVDVGGRGDVPIGAETVVLNVVAVQPGGNGFLTVFPCGEPAPNASNLNYRTGVTAANMVITRIPSNGQLCVFTSHPTHLIVDVVGHFSDGSPTVATLRTFTPGRLVDTRASGATTDGRFINLGTLVPNAVNTYQITNRFPLAEADTAVLNITAVNPSAGGFVTVWPCDQVQPNASSLNFVSGTTRAVQVVTALSTKGTVCVASSRAIHLIIDVAGSSM